MLAVVGFLIAGFGACTKAELVGADLLQNEASQVGFTDTISLKCSHMTEDAILTYSSTDGSLTNRSLVGHLKDPFFGRSEASFYSEVFLFTGSSAFLGTDIDSVILSLRYDTLGLAGDPTQPVILSVHQLTEELDPDTDYRSDYAPAVAFEPFALAQIFPRPYDSLYIKLRGDSVRVPPMVRLPLSVQFINNMMSQDSSTFESADSFRLWMKGIHVKMTGADNRMLGFNLDDPYSEITVYYRNSFDTINSEISFIFTDLVGGGIHHTRFVHDYTGSEVQKFLDNPQLADSLLFVQGMSGVNVAVAIPGLQVLDNILINKAELEFFVAQIPEDNQSWYPPVPQLINAVKNDNGDLVLSEDVAIAIQQFRLLAPFGGNLMDPDSIGVKPQRYVMNVTTSLQDIYKGITENQYFISPFLKASVPNRVMLYGPSHPEYPARLKLTYTLAQ
jgi:hypothetical protein